MEWSECDPSNFDEIVQRARELNREVPPTNIQDLARLSQEELFVSEELSGKMTAEVDDQMEAALAALAGLL